jgi:hypothetical protein
VLEHRGKADAELGSPPPPAAFDCRGGVDERAVEVEQDGREDPRTERRRSP